MNTLTGYEAFIRCAMQPGKRPEIARHRPAITISRQTGCGAREIASALAVYLAKQRLTTGAWTVFDNNLIAQVLEDHNLPKHIQSFMPEDQVSEISLLIEDLFNLHPPASDLIKKTNETIVQLISIGHSIVIGRGANLLAAKMPEVLHVRLVAPLEQRITEIERSNNISRRKAKALISAEESGRARYVKKHFGVDVANPLLYHLTINTGLYSRATVVELMGKALQDILQSH